MRQNKEPSDYKFLNQGQYAAALCAGLEAGEYIESIGKTDLATYSKEEFNTLLLVICNAMNEHDAIPF